ncbi:DNA-binding protein [Actinomadura sp. HBU206391]|uniref:DNA-binding protein n=1 Tax=Actinomadura sp. HBU206391 TaxID=2731692 RepID=UPI0021C568FB|nr:DNA-binding protein [Actinomadura sp. HBU206391]
MTAAEISTLPAVVDLVTAGRVLGLGRTKAYELARAEEFPCRVLRVGGTYLVPTAGLLALLGLDNPANPAVQPPPEDR